MAIVEVGSPSTVWILGINLRFGTKGAYKMSHLIVPMETFKSLSCLICCYMEVKLGDRGC